MATGSYEIRRLTADDVPLMQQLLDVFAEAFDDPCSYSAARPRPTYLYDLLGGDCFVSLVALDGDRVVGGLAAYVLRKFEQERSELYIYDLAVASGHRRQGIATALIEELRQVARSLGAWVIFVQADLGDDPAIELYSKLGAREDVLHFDIRPEPLE